MNIVGSQLRAQPLAGQFLQALWLALVLVSQQAMARAYIASFFASDEEGSAGAIGATSPVMTGATSCTVSGCGCTLDANAQRHTPRSAMHLLLFSCPFARSRRWPCPRGNRCTSRTSWRRTCQVGTGSILQHHSSRTSGIQACRYHEIIKDFAFPA